MLITNRQTNEDEIITLAGGNDEQTWVRLSIQDNAPPRNSLVILTKAAAVIPVQKATRYR